jgi:hypothetical protein
LGFGTSSKYHSIRGANLLCFSNILLLIFPTSYFHPAKTDNFYLCQAKDTEEKLSIYQSVTRSMPASLLGVTYLDS